MIKMMLTGIVAAPLILFGAVNIEIDWSETTGKVKPVNAVGQPPMTGAPKKYTMMHYLSEAGIPYSRLHDVGGAYGQNRYVDIPNIFRDFDADENDAKNYDFAYTDTLMKALEEAGVEPFYRLGVTIENHTELPVYRIYPPKDYAKWARIAEHIIRHYTEGWANGFKMKITYWEIWNEVDNYEDPMKNQMWRSTFDEFLKFYGVVAPYLKAKFPHLKIGNPAFCGLYAGVTPAANCSPRVIYHLECAKKFLQAVKDNGWPMDVFCYHGYCDPDGGYLMANYVRKMLDEYGFKDVEMSFNEWLCEVSRESLGTALQASKIAGMLLALQNSPCDNAMIYDAKCGLGNYAPLFNPLTLKPYKAYYAFTAFNELRKLGEAVAAKSSNDNVWVSAAKGLNDDRAVMLANTTEQAVALNGIDLKGAKVMMTDETRTWERVDAPEELPPYSFVVATWKK